MGEGDNNNSTKEQEEAQQVEQYNPSLSTPQLDSVLGSLAEEMGGADTLNRHVVSVMAGMAAGDFKGAASRLAMASGDEPEVVVDFITSTYNKFERQAASYITSCHNVSGMDVLEWASDNLTAHEKASIANQIYLGRSSVLDNLTTRYLTASRIANSRAMGGK